MEFHENKALSDLFLLKASKCHYVTRKETGYFRVEVTADPKPLGQAEPSEYRGKVLRQALSVAAEVTHNYRFENFEFVDAVDTVEGRSIEVSRGDLESLRLKKIKIEDIVK